MIGLSRATHVKRLCVPRHERKFHSSLRSASAGPAPEGLGRGTAPIGDEERQAMSTLPDYDGDLRRELGLAATEADNAPLAERLLIPSLNVRGMTPWPGAHTSLAGKRFKVLSTRVAHDESTDPPGTILAIDKRHATIACGKGCVKLLRGQLEGKKALDAPQLAAGRSISVGARFGDA